MAVLEHPLTVEHPFTVEHLITSVALADGDVTTAGRCASGAPLGAKFVIRPASPPTGSIGSADAAGAEN